MELPIDMAKPEAKTSVDEVMAAVDEPSVSFYSSASSREPLLLDDYDDEEEGDDDDDNEEEDEDGSVESPQISYRPLVHHRHLPQSDRTVAPGAGHQNRHRDIGGGHHNRRKKMTQTIRPLESGSSASASGHGTSAPRPLPRHQTTAGVGGPASAVVVDDEHSASHNAPAANYRWCPSMRLLTAALLCLCFASVHMMNSNMGMAIVCMVESAEYDSDESSTVSIVQSSNASTIEFLAGNFSSSSTLEAIQVDPLLDDDNENATTVYALLESNSTARGLREENLLEEAPRLKWSSRDQGYIFSAFNVGLLCMLLTGFLADRLNAKWMICGSVLLACVATVLIPVLAVKSVYYAIIGRLLIGVADALLQPAVNSLITRWFPGAERSYALGLATGGRQLGTLIIMPTAGLLCSQRALFGGWPAIFHLSALVGLGFVLIYAAMGADKPSKQACISEEELRFIAAATAGEDCGAKRNARKIPWRRILCSAPVWAAVSAMVCHEFPLMTMIMFLPSYLHDVHHYSSAQNGVLSALPTLSLWISKLLSSYLNTWLQNNTNLRRSTICKVLNSVGSLGLGLFLAACTWLDSTRAPLAVLFLCLSMASAGLHTPGCLTALVSVAPAFSGVVTGLAFFFVALVGIANPILTKAIVQTGSAAEWNLIFYISTAVALLPLILFNLFGSADTQHWARSRPTPKTAVVPAGAQPAFVVEAKSGSIQIETRAI